MFICYLRKYYLDKLMLGNWKYVIFQYHHWQTFLYMRKEESQARFLEEIIKHAYTHLLYTCHLSCPLSQLNYCWVEKFSSPIKSQIFFILMEENLYEKFFQGDRNSEKSDHRFSSNIIKGCVFHGIQSVLDL